MEEIFKEVLKEQKKTNEILEKIYNFWLAMSEEFPPVPDVSYHNEIVKEGIKLPK